VTPLLTPGGCDRNLWFEKVAASTTLGSLLRLACLSATRGIIRAKFCDFFNLCDENFFNIPCW
jgi:hypothetical protein